MLTDVLGFDGAINYKSENVAERLGALCPEGKLTMPLHIVDGLEAAPKALNLLYTGGNTGKLLVRV